MRRARSFLVAQLVLATAIGVSLLQPAVAVPGDTELFTESFESGLGGWTVTQEGNGDVRLVTAKTPAGSSQVAQLSVPDYDSGSIAYLRRSLEQPAYALSVSGHFAVTKSGCDSSAGYSAGSVPLIRMFDTDGRRVAGLYRINATGCNTNTKVYVQHSGSFFRTNQNLKLGAWARWELRLTVNGGNSTVEVYLDDRLVYSAAANNGIVPLGSVTMHNEHRNQVGQLLVDDLRVATFESPIPGNPCDVGAPVPTNSDPGDVVLADGFEDFHLNKWTATGLAGDGSATVTSELARTGACAGLVRATANQGSRAYLNKRLPAGTDEVSVDGWFNVRAEGGNGSNVPYWRLFDGDRRLADVYRLNGSGQLYLRTPNGSGGWSYTSLGRIAALNSWHRVQVHADAARGSLEVRFDGTVVQTLTGVPFGSSSFTSAQVHAEHFVQEGELAVDDVIIKVP